MKKFLKVCLITAGILFGIGLIFCLIGKVYGGEGQFLSLLKDGKFGVEIGDGIVGIKQFDIGDMNSFDKHFEIKSGDIDKEVLAEAGYETIQIEIGGGELVFLPSDDEKIYVEAEGVGKFQAYTADNKVKIKSLKTASMVIGKITVYLPNQVTLRELDLSVGGGTIDMTEVDIYANNINIELGAGQIVADYVESRNVEIEVGAGEAIIENISVDNLSANVGMGDIRIRGDIGQELEVECAMGNADFDLAGAEEDFNYILECAAGNISVGRNDYSGIAIDREIDNGAMKDCSLECAMGNISVRFQ